MKLLNHILPLSLFLVAGCVTGDPGEGCARVLMIGNSFSISLMSNLPKVAQELDVPLDLTSLYIGGCSLERHVENIRRSGDEDYAPYDLSQSVSGEMLPKTKANLIEVLMEGDFDIVTIQQASHLAWQTESFTPFGDELIEAIRKYQPQAKIYVQETWSYTPWDRRLRDWGFDQNEMYKKVHDACAEFAGKRRLPIIKMGTAVQRWRERLPVRYTDHSFGGDVTGGRFQKAKDQFVRNPDNRWEVNSDVFHLNERGEYLQALVWTAKLFGKDVTKCKYRPEKFVSEMEAKLMKEIANELR